MSSTVRRVWTTLRQTTASTTEDAEDPRLRGRTYPIPFEQVWNTAVSLAGGRLRGWALLSADDQEGIIEAEAKPLLLPGISDVTVRVWLDENAQTRVDIRSASREARAGLGSNHRHIARFLRELDTALVGRGGRRARSR